MSRSSNSGYNTNNSKNLYLKKSFDPEIPSNIMRLINTWIDSYNSNIIEKVKNSIDNQFEEKINDTSFAAGKTKESKSSKKADNEMSKYEEEIFKWLSLSEDRDVDRFSTKISKFMDQTKNSVIVRVNSYRVLQKKKQFNPDYKKPFIKQAPTPFIKHASSSNQSVDLHKPVPEIPKVAEKVYKDAWDDHFS
jgi:hypothetical protein